MAQVWHKYGTSVAHVDDLVRVVEAVLGEVVQREQGLVDGREVSRHLAVAIAHVEEESKQETK